MIECGMLYEISGKNRSCLNIFALYSNLNVLVPSIALFAAVIMLVALGMYFRMGLRILRGEHVSGIIDFEKEKLKKAKSQKDIA